MSGKLTNKFNLRNGALFRRIKLFFKLNETSSFQKRLISAKINL